MRTFIIGDIQGCYSALRRLLDKLKFEPATDTLWGAGDLIGRGPESLQTLQFFASLEDSANSVLGNHDLHFLAVHLGIKAPKTQDKFDPILASDDRDALVHWLRHRPITWMPDDRSLLSHAGLYPGWTLSQAERLGTEVTRTLRGPQWQTLLENMYTNEAKVWQDDMQGLERLVFIINAMTRMRWVTTQLELDLNSKSGLNNVPSGLYPWFNHPDHQIQHNQRVLFGHWAALQGNTGVQNCIALDTGYIWGGKLTAFELQTDGIHQIDQ